jgi:NAD(P)-dependent dehydrogenase (short-subunit alcohol dehydrogenase family)
VLASEQIEEEKEKMTPIAGRTALVTGAGSGIGRATALKLASAGARVIATDVDGDAAEETRRTIEADGGQAEAFRLDVTQPEAHVEAVALARSRFGALHIAVNNAGVGVAATPIGELPIESWTRIIDTNLTGVFLGLRAQLPALVASGGGAIVNVASILGAVGKKGSAAYVASKHGVVGLTRSAALEYADDGVRVNAVGPGYIRTPLTGDGTKAEQFAPLHALGRLGTADEVADLIVFLVSPSASFITGSYYPVDGGYLAQ